MVKAGNRSQSGKKVEALGPELLILRDRIEHLGCSLRVTDVGELVVTGGLANVVDLSGSVIIAHLDPAEVPILLVMRSKVDVLRAFETMSGAALVTQPNIVTLLKELEGRCDSGVVHNPTVSTIGNAVHQEDGLIADICVSCDAVHVEDVAVFGRDWVRFESCTVILYDLFEVAIEVRVGVRIRIGLLLLINHIQHVFGEEDGVSHKVMLHISKVVSEFSGHVAEVLEPVGLGGRNRKC